ncbi:MAG: glycosyltransferase family 2 protein [Ruminococcaceae bacterium]|nr:glycosyltransferase family 2 protein [Oscillospiraceae bacterium]
MRFTVFTPTYNRAHTLDRLYHSLQRQTFRDFEWIVVDDGSTDNTRNTIKRFIDEKPFFEIKYFYTENGGKHRAINRAISVAEGNLFFIADSDDHLTDDALYKVDEIEKTIPSDKKDQFAGVCGLDGYDFKTQVGTTFSDLEYLDITGFEREKYNIKGDKKEVFYTDVLRKYPFPTFDNETFISEGIVWDRMAKDGLKLRYFNEIIYLCEYQPEGISNNQSTYFVNSPKGWALFINEYIVNYKLGFKSKWNMIYGYYGSMKKFLPIKTMANSFNVNTVYFKIIMFIIRFHKKLSNLLKDVHL